MTLYTAISILRPHAICYKTKSCAWVAAKSFIIQSLFCSCQFSHNFTTIPHPLLGYSWMLFLWDLLYPKAWFFWLSGLYLSFQLFQQISRRSERLRRLVVSIQSSQLPQRQRKFCTCFTNMPNIIVGFNQRVNLVACYLLILLILRHNKLEVFHEDTASRQ